jgi:hypothetical protein
MAECASAFPPYDYQRAVIGDYAEFINEILTKSHKSDMLRLCH